MNQLASGGFDVAAVLAFFTPLFGALVARAHWPGQVVGILNTVAAVVIALVSEVASHPGGYSWSWAGLRAVVLWIIVYVSKHQTWEDGPGDKFYARVLAFPYPYPQGGHQPGHEPEGFEQAA